MTKHEQLQKLVADNGGVLQTSVVAAAGISKPVLAAFVAENGYERVSRGVYCAPDAWRDGFYLLQLRCPQTVFSHETALFLHDMTDREPLQYTVTAKTGYNPTHLSSEGVKVYSIKRELFPLGKMQAETPYGHPVSIYDPERTVCDVLRSRNSVDPQTLQDTVKRYVRRGDKNLHRLMEYAEVLHVEKLLRRYMEVLL